MLPLLALPTLKQHLLTHASPRGDFFGPKQSSLGGLWQEEITSLPRPSLLAFNVLSPRPALQGIRRKGPRPRMSAATLTFH